MNTGVKLATMCLAGTMLLAGSGQALAAPPAQIWRFRYCTKAQKDVASVTELIFEHPAQYFSMLKAQSFVHPIASASGSKKPPSDPRLVGTASSLKEGDLIKLTFSSDYAVTQIEKYIARPGEDMPDYKEFVRMTTTQFKGQEFPAVVLRRFLRETECPIGRLDADKKWKPDSQLASNARKFVEGDPVEVDLLSEEPGVWSGRLRYFVQRIDAYRLPLIGNVVRVREVPPSNDAECFTTKSRSSMHRIKGDDSVSLVVDLKPEGSDKVRSFLAWEYALLHEATHLKEGQKVYFKTSIIKGKEQLLGLRVLPTSEGRSKSVASGNRSSEPAVHAEVRLERVNVLIRFTTMIKTTEGWRKATVDEIINSDKSQLKNMETIDWDLSYATGSYKQSFQGRDVTGQVLDLGSAILADGTEQPVFVLKGEFYVRLNNLKRGVKTVTNSTQYTVTQEVWKSRDGRSQIILAEGTACLLVSPSAIRSSTKEVKEKDIVGVLPSAGEKSIKNGGS